MPVPALGTPVVSAASYGYRYVALPGILERRMGSGVRTGRRYFWIPSVAVFALGVFVAAGCDFPRDPRGTLEDVQSGTMSVGVVANDPWTRMEDGHASGVEVELLKDFARELGADTTFVPGTTPELLEAARQGEVDVLIGGFTSTSPGVSEGKEAGVTGSYLTTRFVVGVPPGRPEFDDPSGREIAVERIDGTAAMLKEEGAVPVPVDDLSTAEIPITA
jgi:polar amino acid transport system substrate-binding protein